MKNNFLKLILIGICFLPSNLFAGEKVTASGISFFEPGREVIAREKAIDEAKRAAIETALGTAIESRTVVEDFQVVKDQIFSRTSGYLKNLKILSEKKTELGTYEVKIEAEVEISALVQDMDRFQKIIKWQRNPRISIAIDSNLKREYLSAATKAANILTGKLKKNGFSVFKYSKTDDFQIGLMVGLNLEHSSRQTTFQDLALTLNEISLSANIYRPGDGEIIATASAVKSLPGENRIQTLDKGARACIDAIWNELRKELIRLWEKELYSKRNIILIVKGIPSHARAQEIAFIFKSDVSGMLNAELIGFRDSISEYSLHYRGWPDYLLNEIQMSYFKNKYFDVSLEKISGNKLVVKIK